MTQYERLTAEQEIELAEIIRRGGAEADKATERFLLANLRLVYHQVSKMNPIGDQIDDLIQEGSVGLMTAVRKFDPKFGCRFSTYAMWWIRQSITRCIEKDKLVKIPIYRQDTNRKVLAAFHQLGEDMSKIPELCDYFGLEERDVMMALQPVTCTSMSMTLGENLTVADTMASDEDLEASYIAKQYEHLVLSSLDELEKTQKKTLELRFGLGGQKPSSYQKIADVVGVSRSQACQIVSRSLRELRKKVDPLG